jgi:hypothetical protein
MSRTFRDLPHNLLIRSGATRTCEVASLYHAPPSTRWRSAPRQRVSAVVAHGLVPPRHTRVPQGQHGQPPHAVMRKLQLIPEHTSISLALPSELRSSSAFRHVCRGQLTWPWSAHMATRIGTALRRDSRRTAQQGRAARRLETMAGCLDLRAMASISADGYTTAAKPHMYACAVGPAPSAHVHSALPQSWGGGAEQHRAACGRGASWRVRSARSRFAWQRPSS